MKASGLDFDERVRLTRTVLKILGNWEVPLEDQPMLLGLDPGTRRRQFNRYRLGNPLPDERIIYDRIASLVRIDAALEKLFPHSRMSADLWITTPRPKFEGQRPLDLMLRRGKDGMRLIENTLEDRPTW